MLFEFTVKFSYDCTTLCWTSSVRHKSFDCCSVHSLRVDKLLWLLLLFVCFENIFLKLVIEEWLFDENNEEMDSENSEEEENIIDVANLARSSHQECFEAVNVCIIWAKEHSDAAEKVFAGNLMQKKNNQNRQLKLIVYSW